jgi:Phosphoinositide phospholipase C, Ca2+-dependent
LQVRGTHNSYQPPLPPLERQLDEGVRQLELDVWAQPDGRLAVFHSDKDRRSTCPTLDVCLAPVRSWLEAHPKAVPVYLIVENKEGPPPAVDAAVQQALPGRLLVRPREVVDGRWPTLATTRGRAIPVLIGTETRTAAMFVYASSGPLAAITSRPDPVAQAADIAALVRAGLIVRTQADGDDLLIDQRRRQAAVDSGAQIVSARDDGFLLPGGVSVRCDPIVPSPCRPGNLEPVPTTTTGR